MTRIAFAFPKLQTAKDVVRQMSKSPLPEDTSTSNRVDALKYC